MKTFTFTAMAEEWMLRRDLKRPFPQPADSVASCNVAHHDHVAWSEGFHHWALDRCVYRERWFNGIGALHRAATPLGVRIVRWAPTAPPFQLNRFTLVTNTDAFYPCDHAAT
jgi:hypothetical protein